MTDFKELYLPSSKISMEVEGAVSGSLSSENFNVIRNIAISSFAEIESLPKEKRPHGFEISFGLKAIGDKNLFAISLDQNNANFKVKLIWSSDNNVDSILESNSFKGLGE